MLNNNQKREPIRSFRDLQVYNNTYKASVVVMNKIVPKLPKSERFDLKDQISRACKAIPRLIAEGYAKRHQRAGFQKYLDDSMGECNEMIVCLEHCKDIYYDYVDTELCKELIEVYDISGRQIYRLAESWHNFKSRKTRKR